MSLTYTPYRSHKWMGEGWTEFAQPPAELHVPETAITAIEMTHYNTCNVNNCSHSQQKVHAGTDEPREEEYTRDNGIAEETKQCFHIDVF